MLISQGDTMKNTTKALIFGVAVFVGIFVTGCPERRSIAEIERNPTRYADREVAIAGVVRDSYGLSVPGTPIRGGAYKVDDGTGSIWIVTEDVVPLKGTEIAVKGRIGSGVTWKGRNYGLGMYETDRRYRKR